MLFDVGFGLLLMHRGGASIKTNGRENMKSYNSFPYLFEVFPLGRSASCVTGSLDVFRRNQVLVTGKTFCLFVYLSVRCE